MDGRKIRGLIFDMDNTLLHSHIDFKAMKTDVYVLLKNARLIPADIDPDIHTTSTLLEMANQSPGAAQHFDAAWSLISEHEMMGMHGAPLESNALDVLQKLHPKYYCILLTNNCHDAALKALRENGIDGLFHGVYGRERVPALKPSPAGVHRILADYPDTSPENWLSVGDSWIDGKAASAAGVAFIAYNPDPAKLEQHGVMPYRTLSCLTELLTILE